MRRILAGVLILFLGALFFPDISTSQGGTGIGTNYTTYKQRSTAAPTPSSTYNRLYFKTDDKLYSVTSGGVEAAIGSGDVTGVGDCASGACLDGSSDGGTYIRLYDGNSHYTALYAGDSSGNLSFYFPTAAGAAGGVPYFSAANQLAIMAHPGAANYIPVTTNTTQWAWSSTLSISTINLPSTDADPGTTAGQIRHDTTDTDASAGGIIEWWDGTNTRRMVDGAASAAANYTVVVKTEFIPVAYMTDGAAAAAAIATYGTTRYRDFAHGSTKDLKFIWVTPLDLIGTTVKVRAIAMVSNATAPADEEGVSWGISAGAVAASISVDVARGTVAYSLDTDLDNDCNAQYDACYFPYVEVTPAVTVAPGTLMAFTVNRTHDHADDTYEQDIGLVGVEIKYKARINLVDTW